MEQDITLSDDELKLIIKYRHTKRMGHAHGEWDIKDGGMVKLWITEKIDLERKQAERKLMEVADDGI